MAVLGRGAWGSALAATFEAAGRSVVRWSRTGADRDLTDCPLIICATSAQSTREVLTRLSPHLAPHCTLVMAAKGLEHGTLARQSEIAREIVCERIPASTIAVISGPGFADDLADGLPIAVTLASANEAAEALQRALFTPQLRPYLCSDLVGVELGGALKNVIAIASGVAVGAGLGESARAAIIARGFAEMQRIACACGAEAETLLGLAGLGDLTLTATSLKSRNYRFGLCLGETGSAQAMETVEGIATADAASQLAQSHQIDVPVIQSVAQLLAGQRSVREITAALLSRPLRREG